MGSGEWGVGSVECGVWGGGREVKSARQFCTTA